MPGGHLLSEHRWAPLERGLPQEQQGQTVGQGTVRGLVHHERSALDLGRFDQGEQPDVGDAWERKHHSSESTILQYGW